MKQEIRDKPCRNVVKLYGVLTSRSEVCLFGLCVSVLNGSVKWYNTQPTDTRFKRITVVEKDNETRNDSYRRAIRSEQTNILCSNTVILCVSVCFLVEL